MLNKLCEFKHGIITRESIPLGLGPILSAKQLSHHIFTFHKMQTTIMVIREHHQIPMVPLTILALKLFLIRALCWELFVNNYFACAFLSLTYFLFLDEFSILTKLTYMLLNLKSLHLVVECMQ